MVDMDFCSRHIILFNERKIMKKVILSLIAFVAMIGFVSTASARVSAEERARIFCEGKLHACFPGQDLDDVFPGVVSSGICLNTCLSDRTSNENACDLDACEDRCLVAHGLVSKTSCL